MTTLTDYAAKVKEMKEHPIIFSTEMVKAILEGRKSQTRRIVKSKKADAPDGYEKRNGIFYEYDYHADHYNEDIIKCPYGQIGDILWVRESGWVDNNFIQGLNEPHLYWKADYDKYEEWEKVLIRDHTCPFSSIHMYKEFARLRLKITDIRVERLHDISEEDAKAEGIIQRHLPTIDFPDGVWKNYLVENSKYGGLECINPIDSFRSLWKSINGEESWYANPFCWVIKFEKL